MLYCHVDTECGTCIYPTTRIPAEEQYHNSSFDSFVSFVGFQEFLFSFSFQSLYLCCFSLSPSVLASEWRCVLLSKRSRIFYLSISCIVAAYGSE